MTVSSAIAGWVCVAWLAMSQGAAGAPAAQSPGAGPARSQPVPVAPPAVRSACDLLQGVADSTGGASATPRDRWSSADALPRPLPGCGIDVSGSFARAGQAGDAVTRLRNALTSAGWQEMPDFAADGKDGTAFAYRSGPVTCVVRGAWDGGADGEPAIPADDWYRAWVFCTDRFGDGPGPAGAAHGREPADCTTFGSRGRLRGGEPFSAPIVHDLVVRLVPEGDYGWFIVVSPSSSTEPDYVWPVSPPYRTAPQLKIGPGYGLSAAESAGFERDLRFTLTGDDYRTAFAAAERGDATEVVDMLQHVATGTLSLTVTDFGTHPFTTWDGRTELALSWITFTGRACAPR